MRPRRAAIRRDERRHIPARSARRASAGRSMPAASGTARPRRAARARRASPLRVPRSRRPVRRAATRPHAGAADRCREDNRTHGAPRRPAPAPSSSLQSPPASCAAKRRRRGARRPERGAVDSAASEKNAVARRMQSGVDLSFAAIEQNRARRRRARRPSKARVGDDGGAPGRKERLLHARRGQRLDKRCGVSDQEGAGVRGARAS